LPLADLRPSWLRQLAFVFALLAQLAGVALAVEEGRAGLGAGTHIEAVGDKAHYAHDESTCGACHVRSLHGRVAAAPRLGPDREAAAVDHGAVESHPPVADRPLSNPSRAPPTVI
jgi:hypothetical protein